MPQGVGYPAPPVNLEEDLLAQSAPPQQGVPGPVEGASPLDTFGQLAQGDPLGEFASTLLQVAERNGIDLDTAFGDPTVADEADQLEGQDPLAALGKDDLMLLVQKFLAIPDEQRMQVEKTLREELPPNIAKRLDAVLRFVTQQANQQEGTI
jgi:hypothetical protein